jgi:hypothetical protein
MKRLLMTFLVAGLVIISALNLSSCNKKDTNSNANNEEWIPTTFNLVTIDSTSKDPTVAVCPYCGGPVYLCDHGVRWWDYIDGSDIQTICQLGAYDSISNPEGHYHEYCFNAWDDCTPPGQPNYICPRKGRYHRHIVVLWQQGWDNHWHLGGTCLGE